MGWLQLIAGLLLGVVLGICLHEGAHLAVARLLRYRVTRVTLGLHGPAAKFQAGDLEVVIHLIPSGGKVTIRPQVQPTVWQVIAYAGVGPLANLLLAAVSILAAAASTAPVWLWVAAVNILIGTGNLFPRRHWRGSGVIRGIPTDGMAIENALRDSLRRRSWHIGWLKNQVPGVVALLLAAEREAIDRKSPYIAPSDLSRVLRRASDHGTPPIAGLGAAMLAESGYPPPLRALRLRPDSASRRVTALATRNARRARRALAHVDYAVALEDLPDPEFLRSMKDQGLAAGSVREAVEHLGILMRDFAEAQEELLAKKDAMQFWMREQPLLKLPYITARDRAILLNNAAWYLLVYHWPEHAALAEKIARTAFEAWPCYVIRDTLALALVATDHVDAGLELTWGMVDNVELPPSSRGSLLAIAALAAGLRGDNVAQQDYLAQAEQLAADKDLLAMVHRVLELPPKTSEAASS